MSFLLILFVLALVLGGAATVWVTRKPRAPDVYLWVGPGKDPFRK